MRKRQGVIVLLTIVVAMIVLAACKKDKTDPPPATGYDRGVMLANYAGNYIIPAYTDMSAKLQELKTQLEAFTATPSAATLTTARTAFKTAWQTWQKVDMLEFGPGEDVSLRMYMNTYPVTTSKVNSNIAAGTYDLEQFAHKDAQGFPAIDYLLNGLATNDDSIVNNYAQGTATAPARKKYLLDVIAKMLSKVNTVRDNWASYQPTFIAATGTDANSSTSKMVNAFVLYYERYLRSGKVGLPVGAMTGVAKPELAEAYYTHGLDKENLLLALQSVKAFYMGKSYDGAAQEQGMYHYMEAVGTKDESGALMAGVISANIDNAITATQALPTGIKDGVQTNRPAVLALYDKLQAVVPLLKVDMVSAFGISITYVDNDGD